MVGKQLLKQLRTNILNHKIYLTAQTFTSQGKPSAGQTFPDGRMPKYGA